MDPQSLGRREAQQKVDGLKAFRGQLAELAREGVLELTAEQRMRLDDYIDRTIRELAARFDVDTTAGQKQFSWGLRIASTLGGFALCAALVLLFERVWGLLVTPVQAGILIAAPLAALAATEYAARRERTLYFAALLSLIALACFVLNLAAMGSIFNVTSTQNALLVWAAFALAIAYQYGLRIQLILGLGSLLAWFSSTMSWWRGYHWFTFADRPEHYLVAGAALFITPVLIRHRKLSEFPTVYRIVGMLAFFLSVLFLTGSGRFSYLPFDHKTVERLYEAVGFLASAGAMWLGIRMGWDAVVHLGSVFFTILLYIRLYRWFWDWMPHFVFFALVGGVAIVLVVVFKRLRERLPRVGS